jgi:hypothetical protein
MCKERILLRHHKLVILLIASLVLNTSTFAFEKVGTTSFQFLKVMNEARATSMGEAYTSVVQNSDAMFWNPGALTEISGTYDISVSYTNWFLDTRHFNFSLGYKTKRWGTLGLMGLMVDMGYIEETTVSNLGFDNDGVYNPGLTGEKLYIGAFGLGLAYARNMTDKFSFGALLKYVKEDLHYGDASSGIVDIGMLYRTGYRSIKIAAVVKHFGPEVAFTQQRDSDLVPYTPDDSSNTITGEGYPLPQTFNMGISAYLIAPDNSLLFTSTQHSLLVSFDLIHPRDYDQQYGIGLEYGFMDNLYLRGGYKINYDEEGLCLGFGLKVSNYRIDYSYNDYGEYLGAVNRFSIGMLFP